jgi:hypothetical protein
MKSVAVLIMAGFALLVPAIALADAHVYSDPAMSFTAPADYTPVPIPTHDPATFDDPAIMAAFVKNPGKQNACQITLRMQNFGGDASGLDMVVENDLRNQAGSVFVKKTATKLSNGMPAIWQEITIGSGFQQVKIFQLVWADGVRGVQLAVMGRYGAIDEPEAKRVLGNVTAVAYPKYRY